MSIKVDNIDLVLSSTTEPVIIPIPLDFVNKAFSFFLTDIKNGEEILVEFEKPKQLVPSFDKLKSDSTLILQYSNAEPEVPATISLVLELDLVKGEVKLTGFGFTTATLSVESEKFPKVLNIDASNVENIDTFIEEVKDEFFSKDGKQSEVK